MSTENHPVVLGTPPSADDQTDLVENHWVPYDRLQQLLTAEAELTRLRAELRSYEEREAACCPEDVGFDEWIAVLKAHREAFANKVDQYSALLIDLRALVEQWQQHIAQILRGLTAAADRQHVQLEFEAASRIYRACADELAARLSREPHQDTPQ